MNGKFSCFDLFAAVILADLVWEINVTQLHFCDITFFSGTFIVGYV